MRKFNFPLENALKYKVSVEEREIKLLVKAVQRVQAEECALARLKHEKQIQLNSFNSFKADLSTLQQQDAYLNRIYWCIEEQMKKLAEARKKFESQRTRTVAASAKRKSLELLKEKSMDEYRSVLFKTEQNMLDDIGIAAYCRKS